MTRHISCPAAAVGWGAAGAGTATTGVSAGGGTDATTGCVATFLEQGRLRPAIHNRNTAAPTKIHFGKRRMVACSTPRRAEGAGATATGGTETGGATAG